MRQPTPPRCQILHRNPTCPPAQDRRLWQQEEEPSRRGLQVQEEALVKTARHGMLARVQAASEQQRSSRSLMAPLLRKLLSCSRYLIPGSLLPALLVSSLAAPRPTPLLSILGDCLTYALSRHAMHPIALTSAMRNAPYRSHVSHAQCTLSQCALSSIVTPRLPHVVTCHCAIPHA